ncbi:F-box/WD repeat-containing protein 2-like [Anneissia japonica]|uniref:F-box/WD repeat-containing protein 2-like n=1 Tax=Anneissia japonica TaxID=1529436 RepID=UPI001425B4A0|nr:F-box/WD repeat-containing protein 2-like [Anneissia japonica]
MENKLFNKWLDTTLHSFSRKLSDVQKCHALDSLIQVCGPIQLHYLSKELPNFVKRDFLKLLPLELSYQLIKWLDFDSLNTCCLVSKHWNCVINGCLDVWLDACGRLGLNMKYGGFEKSASYWKRMSHYFSYKLKSLKDGTAFSTQELHGHKQRITALYHADGYLASGSDDLSVCIWNIHNGRCEKIIQTHSCADLKFEETTLVTASFNCSVGLWNMETGRNIRMYVGHTSVVSSIDFDVAAEIIVSGSADKTVKIWSLKSDKCLNTFYGHQDWVTKVMLKNSSVDSVSHCEGALVLLGMDRDNIIKVWPISSESNNCLGTLHVPAGHKAVTYPLLPHLQFDGSKVVCACQRGIHIWNFQNLQYERFISSDTDIQLLLGYGLKFYFILSGDNDVLVRYKNNHKILTRWKHPYTYILGRSSSYTAARCKDWLDGWNLFPESGLVFASGGHSIIYLVKWILS